MVWWFVTGVAKGVHFHCSRAIGHSSFPEKRTVTVDTTYVIVDMTCDGEETNLFDCEFDIIQTNYQSRIGIMCANACEEDYQVRIPNPFKYDWSAWKRHINFSLVQIFSTI